MDVAAFCKLPLGIVRWYAPKPTISVVVKATFSLEQDGELRLAGAQEPLGPDRPNAEGKNSEELERPTDFVPRKGRVDVFLVGHAHTQGQNSASIPARIGIGAWEKRFWALSSAEVAAIPLRAPYLRDTEGKPTQVGPLAPWSKGREKLLRTGIDAYGLPLPNAPPSVFDAYAAAPWDQHPESLGPRTPFVLEGLLRRARVARMVLPALRPRVIAARSNELPVEIPLRCDTLGIDTDRDIATFTFRGELSVDRMDSERERLVMALEAPHAPVDWRRLWSELHRASIVKAVEAEVPTTEDDDDDDDDENEDRVTRRFIFKAGQTNLPTVSKTKDEEKEFEPRTIIAPISRQSSPELPFQRAPLPSVATLPPEPPKPSPKVSPSRSVTMAMPPSTTSGSGPSSRNAAFFDLPAASISSNALPFKAPSTASSASAPDSEPDSESIPKTRVISPAMIVAQSAVLPFQQNAAPVSQPAPSSNAEEATLPPQPARKSAGLPFQQNAAPVSQPAPAATDEEEPITPRPAKKAASLPFQQNSAPDSQPDSARNPVTRTRTLGPWMVAPQAAVLPFQKGTGPVQFDPPPAKPVERTRSWDNDDEKTSIGITTPPAIAAPALPFASPTSPPVAPPSKPVFPGSTISASPSPTEKQTIGELAASKAEQPVTAQPVAEIELLAPRLPLDTWAAIKIEIWAQQSPLGEILERYNLDEVDWHDEERRRSELCADASRKGQAEPALAAEQALQRAREARADASPPGSTTVEEYIALELEVERSRRPSAVLAAKGISAIEWKRLRKVFRERAAREPAIAAALRNGRTQRARPGQRPAG